MKEFNVQLGSRKKKSVKQRVNAHEEELAEKLGGVRQPNSGALAHRKGDISLKSFLLESKETDTNSIIVALRDIMKICREAFEDRKTPAMVFTFNKAPTTMPSEWVMMPISAFSEMLEEFERIKKLENASKTVQ